MATITLNPTAGAYLKYEAPMNYSRDEVTVASGQSLAAGTVVGRITASGEIAAWDPAATDGSQTAVGILLADVDAASAAAPGIIVARHAIVVDADSLVWGGTPTQARKDAASRDGAPCGSAPRSGAGTGVHLRLHGWCRSFTVRRSSSP